MMPSLILCAVLMSVLGREPVAHSIQRYAISVDGTEVVDHQTGLVWLRCSEGMYWNGHVCTGTPGRFSRDAAFQRAISAGILWRVPNQDELKSIVDMDSNLELLDGVKLAATDLATFPNTPANHFWSSSHNTGEGRYGCVDFYDGLRCGVESVQEQFYVRLVRSGNSGSYGVYQRLRKQVTQLNWEVTNERYRRRAVSCRRLCIVQLLSGNPNDCI